MKRPGRKIRRAELLAGQFVVNKWYLFFRPIRALGRSVEKGGVVNEMTFIRARFIGLTKKGKQLRFRGTPTPDEHKIGEHDFIVKAHDVAEFAACDSAPFKVRWRWADTKWAVA